MTLSGKSSLDRFEALDGLRGVAALSVVAAHVYFLFGYAFPSIDLAVDFFFALSGFVLAHAYGERLRGGMGAGRFMLLRLIRLYPLYILGTTIGLMCLAGGLACPMRPSPPPGCPWPSPCR